MNPRLSMLKRIEALYGMIEEIYSVTLRQAAAQLQDAEMAIAGQRNQIGEAESKGRQALIEGNSPQWLLAETQRELSAMRHKQLEVIRQQRKTIMNQAREEYGASRTKKEQMKSIVKRNEIEAELIAGRKAQSATDDRFLSRRHWNTSHLEKI